jgi:hypothetical protein
MLALMFASFGFGQGLVLTPLPSAAVATVKPHCTGAGSDLYDMTARIRNAAIGAAYFAVESASSAQHAVLSYLRCSRH